MAEHPGYDERVVCPEDGVGERDGKRLELADGAVEGLPDGPADHGRGD